MSPFLSIIATISPSLVLPSQISYVNNQPFLCVRLEKEIWLLKLKKYLYVLKRI